MVANKGAWAGFTLSRSRRNKGEPFTKEETNDLHSTVANLVARSKTTRPLDCGKDP